METPTPASASTPSASPDVSATPTAPTLPKNASAEDVLRFNPFAKGASVAPGPKTAEPTPAAAPAQTPAGAPPTVSAPPVGTPNQNPEVAAIQALLMQGVGNESAPQQQAGTEAQPEADPFQVQWSLPPELSQALFSGDPAAAPQAANVMMNGIANGVLGVVKQQLTSLVQNLPAMLERQMVMREANQAFYNDFPHLKSPLVKDTVLRVAQATAAAWRNAGRQVDPHDPAFRDAVENFVVMQGLVQRPQGWKHPRMQAAPAPAAPAAPYFGANVAPNTMNGGAPQPRDLLGEIGF